MRLIIQAAINPGALHTDKEAAIKPGRREINALANKYECREPCGIHTNDTQATRNVWTFSELNSRDNHSWEVCAQEGLVKPRFGRIVWAA